MRGLSERALDQQGDRGVPGVLRIRRVGGDSDALEGALELVRGRRVHLDRLKRQGEGEVLRGLLGPGSGLLEVATVAGGEHCDLRVGSRLPERCDQGEVGVGVGGGRDPVHPRRLHGQGNRFDIGAPEGEVGVDVAGLEPCRLGRDASGLGGLRRRWRDAVAQRAHVRGPLHLEVLAVGGADERRVRVTVRREHVLAGDPLGPVLGHTED